MTETELDRCSSVPRYAQIAAALEAEIRAGLYPTDTPVPSRPQTAARWGVAERTAAKAHRWLAQRGYVVSVPGIGMVVRSADQWPEGHDGH